MNSKRSLISLVIILWSTALFVLSACSLLPGGGNGGGNPTPTNPPATPIAIATSAPGGQSTTTAPGGSIFIGGNVYNDANANGKPDAGEQPIAGVEVHLASGDCPGTPAGQTTTTADTPSYKFDNLNTGTYCVSIDAAAPQNAAILGQGSWTRPKSTQPLNADSIKLNKTSKDSENFAWNFASLEQPTASAGQPTASAEQPTAAAEQPTPIPVIATPTAFVQPTGAPAACVYRAGFVGDVTIPDGTVVAPGAAFVKTWRVVNSGTCSWGPGSGLQNLQFVGGNALGAPNLVPIPGAIAVGATADLSINMVAPAQPGSYTSNWKLRADNGDQIGVGPYRAALYASIRVQGSQPPPTNIPPPTNVPPPGQVITFAAGATEAEVQSQVNAGNIAVYTLGALAGQTMQLTLSSNSSSARIAVLAPNGVPLPPQRGNPEGTYWQGVLAATGNYTIQILAGNAAPVANFGLNITIPVRITFAPGAISAQVQGTTSNNRVVTYLLKANGGQNMNLVLNAPPNSAGITIYGLDDGQPLIRSQSGATSFNGPLPATQDYVIQVVPFVSTAVNFTVNVTVQ